MSIKNSIRERAIRTYGIYRSELICRPKENEARYKEKLERENSKEYKLDTVRRSALQDLDKELSLLVEARIKITNKFYKKTLTLFINEYNELEDKSEINLKKLLSKYSTHIKTLVKFDNEVEFNGRSYQKNLGEKFAEKICLLDPTFEAILKPKQKNITL